MSSRRTLENNRSDRNAVPCVIFNFCFLCISIISTWFLVPVIFGPRLYYPITIEELYIQFYAVIALIIMWASFCTILLLSIGLRVKEPTRPRRMATEGQVEITRIRRRRHVPETHRISRVREIRAQETISDGTSESCMVCRHPIEKGDTILICLYCHSQAHKSHLLDWLKEKRICPICRRKLG